MTEAPAPDIAAEATPDPVDLLDADTKNDSTVDTSPEDEAKQVPDGDLLSDDEVTEQKRAPEEYAFAPPDSFGGEIPDVLQAALDQFKGVAKELDLTQDQFQKLVKYDLDRAALLDETAVGEWNARVSGWRAAVMADKDIGGEHIEETRASAQAALNKFGDPDLRALLRSPSEQNPQGMAIGNHPAVLRFISKVGRALAEPAPVDGQEHIEQPGRLKILYPTMFEEK